MASIGTLASGVAHEINNPITSVMLNIPVLEKTWKAAMPVLDDYNDKHKPFKVGSMDYDRLRERLPVLLSDISDGAARVQSIVNELKDFAQQTPPRQSEPMDINVIVKKAIGLVWSLIRKSTTRFTVDYAENLPIIKGNAQRIEQVVVNLLVNACQALPDNDRSIHVTTFLEPASSFVYIQVQDQGSGMSQDVMERIKDPFYTTKREKGGTGLGLAISEKIVQEHGGRLVFTSVLDEGTVVTVSLPVEPEENG
jgi:signal transduction histidine kinase